MAGGQSVANRRVKARAGVGMELIHPGGERTVTGSCHLLRVSGVNILVDSYQRHHRLLDYHGPGVIVAGSGMCSGGRIIDHLKEGIGERRNDILFVGYQAAGTPGRDILKYHRRPGAYVYLDGEKYDIRARIHQLNGYSAHADCPRNFYFWRSLF